MKHGFPKKLTSLILAALMVVSLIPAFAVGTGAADVAGTSVKYTFADYSAGTQYAEGEVHVLDETVTVTTTEAHFTTELRLYSSSAHNAFAIIQSAAPMDSILLNAGNEADTLNVYSSTDGSAWTLAQGVTTTSSYADHTVDLPDNTTYIKLDVVGTKQVRLKYMTITFSAGGTEEPDPSIPEHDHVDDDRNCICDVENCGYAFEHQYVFSETLAEVTCTEPGSELHVCQCGDEKTVVLNALGHSWENDECTRCNAYMEKWVKVTEALADWSGTYLIVYEADGLIFDGSRTTLDATKNTHSVTITDNAIRGDLSQYAFTVAAVDGGYSIRSASGQYIGKTADSNGMNENADTVYTNTISYKDGVLDIIGSGGAYLRYNKASNQLRFRYYKSDSYTGQQPIALYRLYATPATPDVQSVALSLNKGVTVKVTCDISADWLAEHEGAYLTFSNRPEDKITPTAGTPVYSTDLLPSAINSDLTLDLYEADGTLIESHNVSVAAYAEKVKNAGAAALGISAAKYEKLTELLEAITVYGAAAQRGGEALTDPYFETPASFGDMVLDEADVFAGASVTLGAYASVKLNVNAAGVKDTYTIRVELGEKTLLANAPIADYITRENQIVIGGLFPTRFNDEITITVSDGDEDVAYAVFTFNDYLRAIYADAGEAMRNLIVATYRYGVAAEAYSAA